MGRIYRIARIVGRQCAPAGQMDAPRTGVARARVECAGVISVRRCAVASVSAVGALGRVRTSLAAGNINAPAFWCVVRLSRRVCFRCDGGVRDRGTARAVRVRRLCRKTLPRRLSGRRYHKIGIGCTALPQPCSLGCRKGVPHRRLSGETSLSCCCAMAAKSGATGISHGCLCIRVNLLVEWTA